MGVSMVNEMDTKALMSSEVFRTFVANELRTEAHRKEEDERQKMAAINKFELLKNQIKENVQLKQAFINYRKQLNSPEFRASVDPSVVDAIFLLDLED